MDDTLTQVLIICAVFAIIFGPLTARSSNQRQAVTGGVIGHTFHLIAAMASVAILPGILSALVLGGGFLMMISLGVALLATSAIATLGYAVFEDK